MTIEDLEYIFQPQIEQCLASDTLLWFMLEDGDYKIVERYPADDLKGLLPMLDSFQYSGSVGNVPRFTK